MPSETYDNVWMPADGPTAGSAFLTSDQCIGCHDAGSTGLQFDMTEPNPHGDNLLNFSPYGTWRTSPMGLGGRDPIFFAQLASEGQRLNPGEGIAEFLQDTCLGCHGNLGQRQFHIDKGCEETFLREYANATPLGPNADLANYGALARDGISCLTCHHMEPGVDGSRDGLLDKPENRCIRERQELLNADNTGFGRTFTGSFVVGPPDKVYGPFEDNLKTAPMEASLGLTPTYNPKMKRSELCGTCHTIHLPILKDGATLKQVLDGSGLLGRSYEQTTYPEWAFSAYRKELPDEVLRKYRNGAKAESCQGCHMASKDDAGRPLRSKIASIQERSNFPQASYVRTPEEIDLEVRENFARHTLVGMNIFLVKMAQQFPDILGLRTQDPMLVSKGLDPLLLTEQALLDQATSDSAALTVEPKVEGGKLVTSVTVENKVGHKFPSGVSFRRAFLEFKVLDASGGVLWASGRTNGAGVLVDDREQALPGELWWEDDCSRRRPVPDPLNPPHQPHYEKITRQDQAQIYQELVVAPTADAPACLELPLGEPQCGVSYFKKGGPQTTSFVKICGQLKDNRLLPHGYLPFDERAQIARELGAGDGRELAYEAGPGPLACRDPDYQHGGKDSLVYEVDLAAVRGWATVEATLYYQATPPFYLQDRFCTAQGADTDRLYFLAGHLNLDGTAAESWKLKVVSSGPVDVPGS